VGRAIGGLVGAGTGSRVRGPRARWLAAYLDPRAVFVGGSRPAFLITYARGRQLRFGLVRMGARHVPEKEADPRRHRGRLDGAPGGAVLAAGFRHRRHDLCADRKPQGRRGPWRRSLLTAGVFRAGRSPQLRGFHAHRGRGGGSANPMLARPHLRRSRPVRLAAKDRPRSWS